MTFPDELPNDRPFLIAGPCVIESEDHVMRMAEAIQWAAARTEMPLIFKASFDKANRTSIDSYRGPGLDEGLRILDRVKRECGLPILTDFHAADQAPSVAEVADVLQIPAFLSRQTDVVVAAAGVARVVNIKKGQFMAPWDMKHAVAKARQAGAKHVWLTERGASFGYNNLVADMRSLVAMREFDCPIIYDATHSVQLPGGQGGSSGGQRQYLEPLLRAALAVGVDGIFMEVHDDPDHALSDGPNMLPLDQLERVLRMVRAIDRARRETER